MMTEMHEQTGFVGKLKQYFDDSVRNLDAETGARIAQRREQALTQSKRSWSPCVWLPAGAVAAACIALLIYSLLPWPPAAPSQPSQSSPAAVESATVLEQMEMISDLDLYEDLEFYQWLEQYELPS